MSVLVVSCAALAGGLVQTVQAQTSPDRVVVDSLSLSTAPDGQSRATAKVHAVSKTKVQALTVAVRSADGGTYDFPATGAATLTANPTSFTTAGRAFPAGAYTYFVAYKVSGGWRNLSPVHSFTSGTGFSSSPSPTPTGSTPTPTPTPASSPTSVSTQSSTPAPTPTPTSGATSAAPANAPQGIPGAWHQVFGDEFSGSALDGSKWQPNWLGCSGCTTPPVNSSEQSAYAPSQVSVSDGSLHLKAVKQPTTVNGKTYPYLSGLVESNGKAQFTYGAFEARIYTPASGTQIANWPAFWTDGQNWPADGEMDVMEGLGGSACYHFHSPAGGPGGCAPGDYTGWHTYGAEWKQGSVTYFYDGKQVGQITSGITSAPMYLILNHGISSNHPETAVVPADMMVDYVRVWQH